LPLLFCECLTPPCLLFSLHVPPLGSFLFQIIFISFFIPSADLHEVASRLVAESNLILNKVSSLASSSTSHLTLNENVYNWILLSLLAQYFQLQSQQQQQQRQQWQLKQAPNGDGIVALQQPRELDKKAIGKIFSHGIPWKFYSPITVSPGNEKNMMIDICQLNYQQYFLTPHLYPMFKALVASSDCTPTGTGKLLTVSVESIQSDIIAHQQRSSPDGRAVCFGSLFC
jgi:hypothetical protein